MSQIILKFSDIVKFILIVFFSFSTLLIILKLTSVNPTIGVSENSLSMSLAIYKLTMIMVAVGPIVISYSTRYVLFKIASVYLSILESDGSVSPFHEVFELAFITSSSLNQNSKTFNHIMMPLAYIRQVVSSFPNSTTLFFVVFPFSIVYFSVTPLEFTFTLPPSTYKVS